MYDVVWYGVKVCIVLVGIVLVCEFVVYFVLLVVVLWVV